MKRFIAIVLFVCIVLSSCATLSPNESWERLLNRAPRPITVLSVSGPDSPYTAATFIDARGKIFTITGPQFFSFKPGDIIY